ncbi:putative cytochrome c peroxidase [Fragilariopsis cylindrus CCMP1102]|nr:putative cytochrome c peroxidase [Fragilariopsis cylindrus CCMP1102]|eukprot:OEU23718.1 putative cytochrome c peroxidase [Fragilariopsis cylindrus CCMP1102]
MTYDVDAVRQEIRSLLNNPSWDDGSLAPVFLRLAWHSSGTYDAASGTGGSNGAGMRFQTEAADPENAGLEVARAFLEPVKAKYPDISYSDLWILASYVGLENTGGPVIPFSPGRTDHPDETYWTDPNTGVTGSLDADGTVIGWEGLSHHVRNEVFYRMGFNDQEIVALLCGGHVYGRCHPNASGYAGPWVENPTEFSNEYAADMIEDEWTLFVNKVHGRIDDEPNQMMLLSDMILVWDPEFRPYLEVYADDEAKLKDDFGAAFKKLTELGC